MATAGEVTSAAITALAEGFQNTAALVFSVVGVWLALFYTQEFGELFSSRFEEAAKRVAADQELRVLLQALLFAGFAVMVCLGISFFSAFPQAVFLFTSARIAKYAAVFFLFLSFIGLAWSVLTALLPVARILFRADSKIRRARLIRSLNSESQNFSPDPKRPELEE